MIVTIVYVMKRWQNLENKIKISAKDKLEYYDVIPLFPLLGVNNCQPRLHMSKAIFFVNSTEKRINKFSIGYMVNPKLNVNKVFR